MSRTGCQIEKPNTGKSRALRTFLIALVELVFALSFGAIHGAAAPRQPSATKQVRCTGGHVVTTHHQITVDGKELKYTARSGYITLRNHSRQPIAKMFFVAYTLDREKDSPPRPLTFAWNGGPGSPASMIELGLAGPLRAKMMNEYKKPPPPYRLVDNQDTWLRFTDLVFVDPVGTGYSYPIRPKDGKQFWNVQGDIDSIAAFIRIYRDRYERWHSPLFIAGESYGTTRAAGLAETLEQNNIHLTGVILLSCDLNFVATQFSPENELPYVLILPSYTATAFAHKKLAPDLETNLQETLQKAEAWAMTDYAAALLKGDRLSAAGRKATAKQLARYTGLSLKFVEKSHLRVKTEPFTLHLLKDQGRVVAHYDTRMSFPATGGPYNPVTDPSLAANGIGDLIVPYLRDNLDFKTDAFYAGPFAYGWPPPAAPRADWLAIKWRWGSAIQGPVETSRALAQAIRQNSALHVFVGSGYFDVATPFFATQYVFDHMGLDPAQRARVELKNYPSGHMIYLSGNNRSRLTQDVEKFMESALSTTKAHPSN